MCNNCCLQFGKKLKSQEILNKSVLEVGSYNINGSIGDYVKKHLPAKYIGIDIVNGPCVDKICSAEDIIKTFGIESFDILICTEVIEHIKDWKLAISNFKNVLKKQGILMITTRSRGFCMHSYPSDFWRYETNDFLNIFNDFNIEYLERDLLEPGVFIKAIKPVNFKEKKLDDIKLYNIVTNSIE